MHFPFPRASAQFISSRFRFSVELPLRYQRVADPSGSTERTLARYQPGGTLESGLFQSAWIWLFVSGSEIGTSEELLSGGSLKSYPAEGCARTDWITGLKAIRNIRGERVSP